MSAERRTTWRLRRIPDTAFGLLDVTLSVDTTAPAVVDAIEQAARENGVTLERTAIGDPRFGEPVGENEVAGLVVAFKALLVREGGRAEISEVELEHARTLLAHVDATPKVMTVELVDGTPPDTPRFDAEAEQERDELVCEGHPAGPDDPMGETVYCDGSCRRGAA